MDDFWVFGYGSLMWNPGFVFSESRQALLAGYRRALCVRSYVHRGTPERPGLVLGLDQGGSCRGMAFRVEASDRDGVIDYLRERELVTSIYIERRVPIRLDTGKKVTALTYVIDRRHEQYAGALDPRHAADTVLAATGKSGPNEAYVRNTVEHLRSIGIRDHRLERVIAEMGKPAQAGS
ncbi:gamma-glutamylcyclotransferase [Rhizobium sp. NRK18]|uniref:gamma-glutamylcyclotransferase n=1 Tax=Rhizobium sp. NRK18 TaxID=2964667 RepID=UPI0021C46DC7|nr:gamma-glutamylcyclotransferase [Rhizobium sp. NRK18]MCQ2003065.1 gamma-glutamylcyclotransferase [Rhizobium sp. NRK18]